MPIKAIFFDFDGVLVDSTDHKFAAYCHALAPYNVDGDEVRHVQKGCAGQSRRAVLAAMHERFLGFPASPQTLDGLVRAFTEHDESVRDRMRLVPGTIEFLDRASDRFFTAIVSGTPQDVLDRTVDQFHLRPHFDRIRGTPPEKPVLLRSLLDECGIRSDQSVMVGDGRVDQEAAAMCGVRFAGFGSRTGSFRPRDAWLVVDSLPELFGALSVPETAVAA